MPVASFCFVRGITFSWYQKGKYLIDEKALAWTGKSLLVDANTKFQKPTVSSAVLFGVAGASSGFLASVIACKFNTRGLWLMTLLIWAFQVLSSSSRMVVRWPALWQLEPKAPMSTENQVLDPIDRVR